MNQKLALLFFFVQIVLIKWNSAQTICTVNQCRPPAECENLGFQTVCHCISGIKGLKCDKLMVAGDSLCLSNPCWSGGTCRDLGNDWRCECPLGYGGKNCRTAENVPCILNNPCKNNAFCLTVQNNGFLEASCICNGDWTGKFCETPLPFCSRPNPCFNGGSCLNDRCVCLKNYTGQRCEIFRPPDKVIKIYSKAAYITSLTCEYEVLDGTTPRYTVQTGSIWAGQDYGFYIPYTVSLNSASGVTLTAHAVGGVRIFRLRIRSDPDCFHVWGTTLIPYWSHMPCWDKL